MKLTDTLSFDHLELLTDPYYRRSDLERSLAVSIDGLSSDSSARLHNSSLMQLTKVTVELSEYLEDLEGLRGRGQRRQKT
jgi:hypothetical protein